MKNRLTKKLLIAALASAALNTTVDAQNRDKPGGSQGNKGNFGAPNSLRDGHGDRVGNVNRQTVRKPSGEREGNRENTRKPKPSQGRKPGTGMGHVDRPGQNGQKPKPRPNLKELLDLTDEQAKALRAARKKWHEYAKSIHDNKELSKEEKHAKLHEGFHKFNAALKEILNEKQYAQLQELRRHRARPNDREQQAGGQNQNRRKPNGADLRRRIAEALKLTDEQKEKLHAVHHYAIKKIKVILDNKELSKEEKEAEIKAIHQTVRNRRKEIFTDEQKARLRGIHAYLRSQRENQTQPVNNQNGRGGREQGRGGRENGGREQGGRENGGGGQTRDFPKHWGNPPAAQTRDYVKLPGGFGHGSSTLARWIEENIKRDRQTPQPVGLPAPKKPKRKPNPIFAPVKDDPKLPRVLLIGDSISIGYTLATREFLKGKANLHRIPTNGGDTTKGLASIEAWLGKGKWDVIHFNWGLHDLKHMGPKGQNLFPKEKGGKPQVAIEAYEKNLDKLVVRLKKTGAKLIWRNTTPVPPGAKGARRYVGDSVKYNAAAARVMKKHGIPTHDLFTMSKKRMKELMLPANVHYKKEGSRVLGRDVARVIEAALKK